MFLYALYAYTLRSGITSNPLISCFAVKKKKTQPAAKLAFEMFSAGHPKISNFAPCPFTSATFKLSYRACQGCSLPLRQDGLGVDLVV